MFQQLPKFVLKNYNKGNITNLGVTPLTLKFAILQKLITYVTSIRSNAGSASMSHRKHNVGE